MCRASCRGIAHAALVFVIIAATAMEVLAAHPLITDDTGTQGKGKFQIEANTEISNDSGNSETAICMTLSSGLLDTIDFVIGAPYRFLREKDGADHWTRKNGISDLSLAVKWRFYDQEGLSFALKPGATLPTGDEDKGLGGGKPSYSVFLIVSKAQGPFTLHFNSGYILNHSELRDTFHCSLAAEYAATQTLKIVGNFGGETNSDRGSNVHPLFLLGGMIYKFTDRVDVDFGLKGGLNKAEPNYTLMAGIAFRY